MSSASPCPPQQKPQGSEVFCLRPRAPGLPTARGNESSATANSPVVQVGLALAALARGTGAQGWAGNGRPFWAKSCYLQEFCLIGATVERAQAEGTEEAPGRPCPSQSGEDRRTLWAQAGH